jgi:hypothetical protein
MQCPIPALNLLTRRQYRLYTGQSVVNTGGYPYVLSDTVPNDTYWIVWQLSAISGKNAQVAGGTGTALLLLQNGAILPKLPAGNNPDDPFFLNYFAFNQRAFGPGAYGLRVDRFTLGTTGGNSLNGAFVVGDEVEMLDRPLLVGPGETLMLWQQYSGTPSNPGAKYEMRLALSVMLSTEDIEIEF